MNPAAYISQYLMIFNRHPRPQIPMFPRDAEEFIRLTGCTAAKTVRNADNEISIVMFNVADCVTHMKRTYGFLTEKEATKELKEAREDA